MLSDLESLRRAQGKLPGVLLGLVLTPTRELALQIGQNMSQALHQINHGLHPSHQLRVTHLIGGVSTQKQLRVLRQNKPHVIIATPGRLHELLGEEIVNFRHLKFLIVDEADRMVEMGHFKEVD